MIWTREQAKALTDRALSFSKAEARPSRSTGGDRANLRFARNTAPRRPARAPGYSLAITAGFGKRSRHRDDRRVRRCRAPAGHAGTPRRLRGCRRRTPRRCRPSRRRPTHPSRRSSRTRPVRRRSGGAAVREDRHRLEQEARRRVRRLRRDPGGGSGHRQLQGPVRLRPLHRGRLQPHRAHAGRDRLGMGVTLLQRAEEARSRGAGARRDREGGAVEESGWRSSPGNTPSSSSRRRWRICSPS